MNEDSKAPAVPSLGGWNFYFLAKLALYWRDVIGLHPLPNIAFAALLLLPLNKPQWRQARSIAAYPLAIMLLYYDSWLPPFRRAISQAAVLSTFSFSYMLELLQRFFNLQVAAMLIIILALYRILAQKVRFGMLVVVASAVSAPALLNPAQSGSGLIQVKSAPGAGNAGESKEELNARVQAFFAREAGRSISFPAPDATQSPFDVIFLHVCSLSWDDVHAMGLDNHPLWQRFDYLFSHFNSAATYSGPAVIRLLRSTCGQSTHAALYDPAPDKCYLMSSLQRAGYKPSLAMTHDGHFGDFLKFAQAQGGMNVPLMSNSGLTIAQHAFDDSPVYDDLAVLSRWLDTRQQDDSARVALYYDSNSLHDGNHVVGEAGPSSIETYKSRLTKFLNETDEFMRKLENSGRRAVVVMIPEHGASVRGDKMQIAGLREIPTPNITLVPVGIKVIGSDAKRNGESMHFDQPTSFLAVNSIIAKMLEKSPFAAGGFSPADYAASLPETDFVAENQEMLMLRQGNRYFLRQDANGWSENTAMQK